MLILAQCRHARAYFYYMYRKPCSSHVSFTSSASILRPLRIPVPPISYWHLIKCALSPLRLNASRCIGSLPCARATLPAGMLSFMTCRCNNDASSFHSAELKMRMQGAFFRDAVRPLLRPFSCCQSSCTYSSLIAERHEYARSIDKKSLEGHDVHTAITQL